MNIKESKSVLRTLKIEESLWEAAKEKAGLTPISAIVRSLIKMWVQGEVKVDLSKK